MLALLLCLSLAPPAPPPRPVVVLPLVRATTEPDAAVSERAVVVDDALPGRLSERVHAAFVRNPELVVTHGSAACADEACAGAVSAAAAADVVYGTVGSRGGLLVVDLHLFEVARGGAIMRARVEAPDAATLEHQIDDVAVRMLGGEPQRTLSPWLVAGGLTGALGVVTALAGGAGTGWALWVKHGASSSSASQQAAGSLLLPSLLACAVGGVVGVAGVSVVGHVADE